MSVDISAGRLWENVRLLELPAPGPATSATVSGEVLTCEGDSGTSAKATRVVQARAGDKITVSCVARLLTGTGASISIDYPRTGFLQSSQTITSTEWKSYSVSYIVDERAIIGTTDATGYGYVAIQFGVFASQVGKAEYMLPKISVDNSQSGAIRTIANATIKFDQATNLAAIVDNTEANHACYQGVYTVAVSTDDILITIDPIDSADPEVLVTYFPLVPQFTASLTLGSGQWDLTPHITAYNKATGVVTVNLHTAAGAVQSLAGLANDIYFNFKAEVN